jgi:hypothetical protein
MLGAGPPLRNAPLELQISHASKKARYSRYSRFFRESFPSQPISEDSLTDPEFSGRFAMAPLGVFGVTAQGIKNLVGGHTESCFKGENSKCPWNNRDLETRSISHGRGSSDVHLAETRFWVTNE